MRVYAGRMLLLVLTMLTVVLTGCGDGAKSKPTVKSVEVTTADGVDASLAKGTSLQLKATAILSNDTTRDITAEADWSTADAALATVNTTDARGLVTANGVGSTQITASLNGISASIELAVTAATVTRVEVAPAADGTSLPKGTSRQFKATAVFSDSSTQDVTGLAAWASSAPGVLTVSNADPKGIAQAAGVGSANLTADYAGKTGVLPVTVTAAVLTALELTPVNPSVAKGVSPRFTAIARYSDDSVVDITENQGVTWSSAQTSVATISNAAGSRGQAATLAKGSAVIAAAFGGLSVSTTLTVTDAEVASLSVTPAARSVAKGIKQQFTAAATFTDGTVTDITGDSNALWSSSNEAVAKVSNAADSRGLATTLAAGVATVSVSYAGKRIDATLTVTPAEVVSLSVTPATPSVARGIKPQFTASATYTDGSVADVTADSTTSWSSSAAEVASVSNAVGSKGLVTTLKEGSSSIQAAFGGKSASTTLTVTAVALARVEIDPATLSIAKGHTHTFKATAIFTDDTKNDITTTATWSSSDTDIAVVSNATKGRLLALSPGEVVVSAVFDGVTGTAAVTVTPATLSSISVTPTSGRVAPGFATPFKATGTFSDGSTRDVTTEVAWLTSDDKVAAVSNAEGTKGLVYGAATGTASITASASGVQQSRTITVTSATLTSIDVTALEPPTATPSLPNGTSTGFKALGHFDDGSVLDLTTQVTWGSEATDVATISNAAGSIGLAKAEKLGSTVISASKRLSDSVTVTGKATLTVVDAALVEIEVTPASGKVASGLTLPFKATGIFTDGLTRNITDKVTWSSSDSAVATVSNADASEGVSTGHALGKVTVTASLSGVQGQAALEVTAAVLQGIAISTEAGGKAAVGDRIQYVATGSFSDGSTLDLTSQVVWFSSGSEIAEISNADGSHGLATVLKAGKTDITASHGELSAKTVLEATDAVVRRIDITPADLSVPAGTTRQLAATAVYSDGRTQVVTAQVNWQSDTPSVATASNSASTKGLLAANAQGKAVVTAADPVSGVSARIDVTVSAAILTSVSVKPDARGTRIPAGYSLRYTATGGYSDGTQADISDQVLWSVFDSTVATVSNAAGQKGVVTGTGAGETLVIAALNGHEGNHAVVITNATLASIAVGPSGVTLTSDAESQLAAVATFSDGFTLDITSLAAWTSSNTSLVTVTSSDTSRGLVKGVGFTLFPTNVTITATQGGKSGTVTVSRRLN